MRISLIIAAFAFFGTESCGTSQQTNVSTDSTELYVADAAKTYPVVVSFHSECCGVPDSKPLINMINAFKKKYRIKNIAYIRTGPLGREGEYSLSFPLKELNAAKRKIFIQKVQAVVLTMKDRGSATVELNVDMGSGSGVKTERSAF